MLLDYLISIGATWISGKEIEKSNDKEDINHWDIYEDNTCYEPYISIVDKNKIILQFSSLTFLKNSGYKIYECEDIKKYLNKN